MRARCDAVCGGEDCLLTVSSSSPTRNARSFIYKIGLCATKALPLCIKQQLKPRTLSRSVFET